MTTPQHRNQLNLRQKFHLFAFIKKHRDALCNPTPENYKTLDEWCLLAASEIGVPIRPTVLSRYAATSGHPLNSSLRRSIASTKNNPASHLTADGLTPTIKYATLCQQVRTLESRITSLETALGVTPPKA